MNSTTFNDRGDDHGRNPAQLEREIAAQRDSIGNIIDALEDRLSPGQMLDRVMRAGKGGGGDFARNLGDTVRANPLPALLSVAGLLWLYTSRSDASHGNHGHLQRVGAPLGGDHDGPGLGERASDFRQELGHRLGDAGSRIGETAHAAADSMRSQAQRAQSGFEHLLHDNPMAAGAMAVAVGALLGALVPVTRAENRFMGEASERLTDKAKDAARDLADKGKEVVRQAGTDDDRAASGQSGYGNPSPESGAGTTASAGRASDANPSDTPGQAAGVGRSGSGQSGSSPSAMTGTAGVGAGGSGGSGEPSGF